MKRLTRLALTVALLVLCAGPAEAASPTGRVVIVSLPSVTWEDAESGLTPTLSNFAKRGSIASLSVRTVGSRTDLASAYATISSGNRARATGDDDDPIRPFTHSAEKGLVVMGMDDVRRDNRELRFGALPGALGDILASEGLRTAVVGNADGGFVPPDAKRRVAEGSEKRRFAGLSLADSRGRVGFGDVGDGLVTPEDEALSGSAANHENLFKAFRRAYLASDVILIEIADAYREGQVAFAASGPAALPAPPPEQDVPSRSIAVGRDDKMLGLVLELLDLERDTVFVIGAAGLGPAKNERLMIAAAAGPSIAPSGWLTSPTTRRNGIVTLADFGPTIAELIGAQPERSMTGQPIRSVGRGEAAISRLVTTDELASFHLNWVDEFFATIVAAQIALYLYAWRRLERGRGGSLLRFVSLVFLAVPFATMFHRFLGGGAKDLVVVALVAVSVAAASMLLSRNGPVYKPALIVGGVTLVALLADVATGASLQLSGLIGYSPIVGGRFYGVGNIGFALIATLGALVTALVADTLRNKALFAAIVGLVILVLEGHPSMGADFGGIIALVPAFGVLVLLAAQRRISVARLAAFGVAGLLAALAAGFVDSTRSAEDQTHLGRFVSRIFEDPSSVLEIIVRKASSNWSLLTGSVLTLSIPAGAAFLIFFLIKPRGRLREALQSVGGLRNGLIACVVANVAGFAVNDSGVAIPAIGIATAIPFCLSIVAGLPRSGDRIAGS